MSQSATGIRKMLGAAAAIPMIEKAKPLLSGGTARFW